ncbi:hypothetical protein DUI87_08781 [Hirundo rustica rustica]|uniref:Nop domain-containing protein n=1 Tax=Hirundo rustica rustica TaxID=333673 RepID=A0A3M0KKT5_HIRRU|nr:hypothetical protein DUI87_08781 [Hirundo rustica rustica]
MVGVAGGLLSKLPACNILLLGAQCWTLPGFSCASILPRTSFIYHSDIVRSQPLDLRMKVVQLMAARVDICHESQDGKEDLGFSLGHLGKAGSGRLCQTQVKEATKAQISKALQRTRQKQSVIYRDKSTIQDCSLGTAWSVAFIPLQGLVIVNLQEAEKRVPEANQKYFSSMAKFLKVKGNKNEVPIPLTPLGIHKSHLANPKFPRIHPNGAFSNFL